jgi:hypothetical protein
MEHKRRDWYETHGRYKTLIVETYRAMGKVPMIKDVALRHGICARNLKNHKRHIDFSSFLTIGRMTQVEYDALTPKWQGVRFYKKSEISCMEKRGDAL